MYKQPYWGVYWYKNRPMAKFILNSRDELTCIDIDMIAVIQANGNYSRVVYMNKKEINLTIGISKLEEIIKAKSGKNKFIRLGRSIIVNHSYLFKIDILRQQLTLSDGTHEIRVNLSKRIIKPYKEAVLERTKTRNKNAEDNTRKKRESAIQD